MLPDSRAQAWTFEHAPRLTCRGNSAYLAGSRAGTFRAEGFDKHMSTPRLSKKTPWLATLSALELRRLFRRVRLSSRPPQPRLPDAA